MIISATKISSASAVKAGTTLAVVYKDDTAYLYYTDTNKIHRVNKMDGKWGSDSTLSDAQDIDGSSQLTATLVDSKIHLFYEPDGGESGSFEHFIDSV